MIINFRPKGFFDKGFYFAVEPGFEADWRGIVIRYLQGRGY